MKTRPPFAAVLVSFVLLSSTLAGAADRQRAGLGR
jgi:hypothetical protein